MGPDHPSREGSGPHAQVARQTRGVRWASRQLPLRARSSTGWVGRRSNTMAGSKPNGRYRPAPTWLAHRSHAARRGF